MEKANFTAFLLKLTPLSLAAFIFALLGRSNRENFYDGLGDNFPYLSRNSVSGGKGL